MVASRHAHLVGLLLVLLLATALRFHRLEVQSFWNDEGNSARLSERSLSLILSGAAGDVHPPLYYLLLRGWRELLGESEFGLRSLSAYAGVLLVAATHALGRTLAARSPAAGWLSLAALLMAVNPALVYYSQEARMYMLLPLLATLSTLLFLRWRDRQGLSWPYVLTVAAGLYTHYFFLAVLLVHGLCWLLDLLSSPRRRPHFRRAAVWLASLGAALLLYLPWLPVFLRQAGARSPVRPPLSDFVASSGRWLAFGPTISPVEVRWGLIAVVLLLALALVPLLAHWRRGRRANRAGYMWLLLLLPLALLWAAGLARPAYDKFMALAVPPLALLLAQGAACGWQMASQSRLARWPGRPTVVALFLAVLVGGGRSLRHLYLNPAYARADYRAIAARVADEAHPNAGVILDAPNQWEVFTYYHRQGAPVYPLPLGPPDAAALDRELSQIAARHDRLYVLFWGDAERDPERLVERWLDAHAFKATEEWAGDVRFVTYGLAAAPAATIAVAAGARFGDHITLLGYTLGRDSAPPGDVLPVTLFWRAETLVAARYKVFLHLLDGGGRLVAQRDGEPGGGLALTTTWQPGATVVDNHGLLLPPDLPPGPYRLLLGLYDLADPAARLPVSAAGAGLDHFPLGLIQVTQPPP